MLNRTNRTLSANRNRLNLGTRSLVVVASGIDGKPTLRLRQGHGFAMRDRMFGSPDPSIQPSSPIEDSADPGSSPARPWPVLGLRERPTVAETVTPSEPRARPAQTSRFQGHVKHDRKSYYGRRLRYAKAAEGCRVFVGRSTAAATAAAAAG